MVKKCVLIRLNNWNECLAMVNNLTAMIDKVGFPLVYRFCLHGAEIFKENHTNTSRIGGTGDVFLVNLSSV